MDGDDIEYSDLNVLGIIDRFNEFVFQELIDNNEEK